MQTCAVIGCGPAGMVASTVLRQSGLLVTCFDLNSSAGGMWLADSRRNFSERGLTSPLYPSMRCVLPKDIMAFSDYGFDATVPQFPHHSSVKHYLGQYASRKGVTALTRFNTKVQSARYDELERLWKLVTVNLTNGDVLEWTFDNVCVCTGQTQEPRFPAHLKTSMKDFIAAGGEIEHACHVKDFRSLRKKRVVVVGDGVTAADYCAGLHEAGATVLHSTHLSGGEHHLVQSSDWAKKLGTLRRSGSSLLLPTAFQFITERRTVNRRIRRVGVLTRCEGRDLVFNVRDTPTGPSEEILISDVDSIICATGYTQRYPFLHDSIRRQVEEEGVSLLEGGKGHAPSGYQRRGLYFGTLYAAKPSLAFVGLQKELLPPFLLFEVQSRFVSYCFTQRIQVPAQETMQEREDALAAKEKLYTLSDCGQSTTVNSCRYYDLLQKELGVSSRDSYSSSLSKRRQWLLLTAALRVYHKLRSLAPLKRKKQHVLFSNEI